MWKNVIKVMRSKFFKDTLKNGDYTIKKSEKADKATTTDKLANVILGSIEDLNALVQSEGEGTYAVSLSGNIQVNTSGGSSVTLPKYSKGVLVKLMDAALVLTTMQGAVFTAFYHKNETAWRAKKNLSGLSILGSDNKVTAPGLYAVTLYYSASGAYVTHMISILDLNTRAYSSPDVSQAYAVFVPETKIIASSNEVTIFIEKVVCIAEYNF